MKAIKNLIIILICLQTKIIAQNAQFEVWGGYIGNIALNQKWRIWNDVHIIPTSFGMFRYGITYQTKSNYQITIGPAYLRTSTPFSNKLEREEHRIWGEIQKNFKINSKFRYITRYRYDGRFRERLDEHGEIVNDAFRFNHRHRWMNQIRYHFYKTPQNNNYLIGYFNEILYQSGNQFNNSWDQVRNFMYVGYQNSNITLLAGYHQRFFVSQQPVQMNQGITVWLIHSIDFKSKKSNESN